MRTRQTMRRPDAVAAALVRIQRRLSARVLDFFGFSYAELPVATDGGVASSDDSDTDRLEKILTTVPDCIVQFDADGRFVFANRRAEEVLGLDRSAVTERTYDDPEWEIRDLDDDPIPDDELPFAQVRDSGEPVEGYRHSIEWPDGNRTILEVNGAPLFDDEGAFDGAVFSLTDITQRIREERKREEVIERVTDAIVEVDADWRFTLVNDQAEDLYDMSESSLLGRDFWDVFEAAKGTRFETEYRSVMETREPTSFVEYFAGLEGWFDVQVYPNDDGGLAFYFHEVTDRRERDRRYEAVFDNSYTFLGLTKPDGTVVEINETALRLGDVTREAVVGERLWEGPLVRSDPEAAASLREAVETAREGELFRDEIRIDAAGRDLVIDFTVRPITDDQGTVTLLVPEGRDVTEVRKRERAIEGLHSTDQRLLAATTAEEVADVAVRAARDVLELPAIGVFSYDAETDALEPVAWAEGSEGVVGDLPTFERGEGIAWTVYESGEARHFDDVSTAPGSHNPETNVRSEIVLPLGDHGVLITGSPEADVFDDMDVSLAESLANHVTSTLDRIERERALREERERAEELSRQLSVLNRVLRHDLRNRANVIMARTDLLEYDSDPAKQGESIKAEAQRLVEMGEHARAVERLLREDETVREPIDLVPVVEDHLERIETEHPAVDATASIPETAPVMAHPLIDLAIGNVLDNAVEHNQSDEPTVAVECERVERDGARHLELRIVDDGPGIPDAEVAVLERGYETQLEHTSGLGLWLVNWIVTESGGDVWFEENDPTGSVVGIRLVGADETPDDA